MDSEFQQKQGEIVSALQGRLLKEATRIDVNAAQDARNWAVALGVAIDKLAIIT